MKIYHYQRNDRQPNFGDELNQWLWPQLMPDYFGPEHSKNDDAHIFIGTGILLNSRLPQRIQAARHVSFIGTGAVYEQPLQQIPKHWHIYCVRGPLSAQQLHLPASKAIADGGILVNRIFPTASLSAIPPALFPIFTMPTMPPICGNRSVMPPTFTTLTPDGR
ncbi:MAG: hypothetical protein AAGI45_22650 [Cyanobacteria bacterium P01_H01_bin.26]